MIDGHLGDDRLVVCVVARRGRFIVAERFFDPGGPLTLGRRGSVAAEPGDLVAVRPERGRGSVIERLGRSESVPAMLRGRLIESGTTRPFPEAALAEARRMAVEPDGLDEGRADLRDLPCVTVDPPGARDFDDAITVRREGDGLRVWVHIADVSWHVRVDGELDREARRRGNSVYVPGQVEPMLPHELSSGVCSLQEGRDRRAVTVELDFDARRQPGRPRFYRSLIRSSARLTYAEAHAILEGRARHPVAGELLQLSDELAGLLRKRRQSRGALEIDPRELRIDIAGDRVTSAVWEGEPRAHALVEEMMILANEAVAEHLARLRRPAIYRIHEPPDPASVEALVARLADLGVPTVPLPDPIGPGEAAGLVGAQARALAAYLRGQRHGREAFTTLLLRSLKQARYDPANLGHAGLASRAYAHFTSPIRRYPDLVVHRALCASVGLDEMPPGDEVGEIADHASLTERAATVVERDADDLCLAALLSDRLRQDDPMRAFAGEVTGLIGAGLFIRFGSFYTGFLPSRRLDLADRFDPNDLGTALVGRSSGRRWRLGDEIEVRVATVEEARGRISLELASTPPREPRADAVTRPRPKQRQPVRRHVRRRR